MDLACVCTGGTGGLLLLKISSKLWPDEINRNFTADFNDNRISAQNLHLPARWGWGHSPSLDTHSWSAVLNTQLFPAFSSHRVLHSSAQRTEPNSTRNSDCAGSSRFVFWPKHPRDPLLLQVGSEEGERCYSVADEMKRAPHPPQHFLQCSIH